MHVKTGDEVLIIAGKDKGKRGKIKQSLPKDGRVVVEGLNMIKRHMKQRGPGKPGGIIDMEAPLQASNVMLICPQCGKACCEKAKGCACGDKAADTSCCEKCAKGCCSKGDTKKVRFARVESNMSPPSQAEGTGLPRKLRRVGARSTRPRMAATPGRQAAEGIAVVNS